MWFFSGISKKKKSNGRGASIAKTVQDKMLLEELSQKRAAKRRLKALFKEHPQLEMNLAVEEFQAKLKMINVGQENSIENLLTQYKKLKDLVGGIEEQENENPWAKTFRDIVKEAAPFLGPVVGANMAAYQAKMQNITPAPERPRITTVPQGEAVQQIEEAESEEEEQPLSLQVSYAIGQLRGKAPQDAARWILGLPFPEVRSLAQQLYNTPDEQLPNLLVKIEQQAPDYRPLVAFLRSDPKWFVETVHAIRDIVGASQEEPAKAKKKIMGF